MIRFTNGLDGVFAHIEHNGHKFGVNVDSLAKEDGLSGEFFKALSKKVKTSLKVDEERNKLEYAVIFSVERAIENGMCPFEIETAYEELEKFNKDHKD